MTPDNEFQDLIKKKLEKRFNFTNLKHVLDYM